MDNRRVYLLDHVRGRSELMAVDAPLEVLLLAAQRYLECYYGWCDELEQVSADGWRHPRSRYSVDVYVE